MINIKPENVISTVREHLIGDGFEFVLDMEKSHGSYLHDALTGKDILDFYSCFASNPLGFNHPKMLDETTKARLLAPAIHNVTNSDLFTTYKAEFVATWFKLAAPPEMKYMFLIAGGGLAIENALKAAFDWKWQINRTNGDTRNTGTKVLHFKGAFHGRTGYTMSLTNTDPSKTDRFPKFTDWPRITNPYMVFPDEGSAHECLLKREAKAYAEAEHAILQHGNDIAAFVFEPIQGEGGDNHFRTEFLQKMQALCNDNDIIFIVDEVQSGMGLTGKMWAHEHHGLKPDIIVFGKKAQVCGIMASAKFDRLEHHVFNTSSRINSTWGGNLVDMVRCQRYLEIFHEDKLLDNATKSGKLLLDGLVKLQKKYPSLLSNARGRGLMCAFDLPDATRQGLLWKKCYEMGMLVLKCGTKSIRFRPVLTVGKKEITQAIETLDKVLASL